MMCSPGYHWRFWRCRFSQLPAAVDRAVRVPVVCDKRELMGEHVNQGRYNILVWTTAMMVSPLWLVLYRYHDIGLVWFVTGG